MMSNKFGGTLNMVHSEPFTCATVNGHQHKEMLVSFLKCTHSNKSLQHSIVFEHLAEWFFRVAISISPSPWPTLIAILFAHTLVLSFISQFLLFLRFQANRNKIVCKLTMHSCRTNNARITAALVAFIWIGTVFFLYHYVFVCMWHWTISNIMQLKAPYIKTGAKMIPFSWKTTTKGKKSKLKCNAYYVI